VNEPCVFYLPIGVNLGNRWLKAILDFIPLELFTSQSQLVTFIRVISGW
jgi:hypothetical protein